MKISEAENNVTGTRATIKLNISGSGLRCLWEAGGSNTNTGDSRIICDRFGNPKKAIKVPTSGDLSNGQHALIPVVVGDMVIEAERHREKNQIFVWEIIRIDGDEATLQLLEYCRNTSMDNVYYDAVMAAIAKANDYHCRSVYYAQLPYYMQPKETINTTEEDTAEENIEDEYIEDIEDMEELADEF